MWDESLASRGAQEIGSCLLHYLRNFVQHKNLIMYSDQCGGQSRNIKMALLCHMITDSPEFTVERIDHKFYISGHSYLPCDRDFGLVTRQKKYFPNIYIPSHWKDVVLAARKSKPFKIVEMKREDFVSTKNLEKNICNRKVATDGSKMEWLKIQWLLFHKIHPYTIYFKYSNNDDVLFASTDLKKRTSKALTECELEQMYPKGRAITKEKKKDLLSLMDFVPPIYHTFYENLKISHQEIF